MKKMNSRQKIEQWIGVILREDEDNLSYGSVKTLHMIKNELANLEKEARNKAISDHNESLESSY